MSFSVSFGVTPRDVSRLPKRIRQRILDKRKRALLRTAIKGTEIILNRTERGIGVDGRFKPYSTKYAGFRRERGATLTPNLFLTGRMLGNVTQRANSNEARIFFSNAEQAKKATRNDQLRPFFSFNSQETSELAAFFRRELMR
jgi:hypothetical protein